MNKITLRQFSIFTNFSDVALEKSQANSEQKDKIVQKIDMRHALNHDLSIEIWKHVYVKAKIL